MTYRYCGDLEVVKRPLLHAALYAALVRLGSKTHRVDACHDLDSAAALKASRAARRKVFFARDLVCGHKKSAPGIEPDAS